MKTIIRFLAITLLYAGLIPSAFAQQNNENHVQIRLIAEHSEIKAGEEIWIGIEKSIAPHWHTYWINPGDSGTPLNADWTLPEGFTIGDIHWPTPQKITYGPLLNYGYEGNTVLLQKLNVPNEIPEGEITLSADIELLVCEEICIPEYGTYTLTLNAPTTAGEDNTAFFKKAASKLPQPLPANASVTFHENNGNLALEIKNLNGEKAELLPLDWGIVTNHEPASITKNGDTYTLSQKRGERALEDLDTIKGLLAYNDNNGAQTAYKFEASPTPSTATTQTTSTPASSGITTLQALLFALLGGMILNLMPCVFPVLSIKALSLIKIANESPEKAKIHGLAYTAGVVLSFLAIAALLLVLKAAGAEIGWGFQLQNPVVVGGLALLLFAIGLNLSGYFEFGKSISVGNTLTQKQGPSGAFFTGILATAVATPCTAPFMAGAIGFALTQSAAVNLLIFAALGLGLALPYLALSFMPALQKIMPKPGAWMDVFKQSLAFPMFLSAIWLTWVLTKQTGASGLLQILLAASTLTFGIWLFKFKNAFAKILAYLIFATTIALVAIQPQIPQTNAPVSKEASHKTYSPQALDQLLKGNNPIFVEMTADWCITCKVNAKIGIKTNATRTAFADNNVEYLIGDWTNGDADITQYLESHGRNGVPLYVYYGPRNKDGKRPDGQVLQQILTPTTIPNLFK